MIVPIYVLALLASAHSLSCYTCDDATCSEWQGDTPQVECEPYQTTCMIFEKNGTVSSRRCGEEWECRMESAIMANSIEKWFTSIKKVVSVFTELEDQTITCCSEDNCNYKGTSTEFDKVFNETESLGDFTVAVTENIPTTVIEDVNAPARQKVGYVSPELRRNARQTDVTSSNKKEDTNYGRGDIPVVPEPEFEPEPESEQEPEPEFEPEPESEPEPVAEHNEGYNYTSTQSTSYETEYTTEIPLSSCCSLWNKKFMLTELLTLAAIFNLHSFLFDTINEYKDIWFMV